MKKTLSAAGACLLLLVWGIFFRPIFLGGPASYIIVSGISMEPTFFTGDLVVMRKAETYQVGDVIVYRVEKNNVIHRIVGGSASSGFLTQGDNKPEIDPWMPKPEDILGKLWLHVPDAGIKLHNLGSPVGMAGLAGLTVLFFLDDLLPDPKKKRKGKRMKFSSFSGSIPFRLPNLALLNRKDSTLLRRSAAWLLPMVLTGLTLGALFLALAVISASQPASKDEVVTRQRYTHYAVFHYTVNTLPSPLYTGTRIGPVGPETATSEDLPPVINDLAQSIDIDLQYTLNDIAQNDLQGQLKSVLRIEIGEEWQQNFTLSEPVNFEGPMVSTRITVPMKQLRQWVEAIVQEIGYYPSSYTVKVIPTITLGGAVDGEPVSDTYAPEFKILFRTTQAQMETELVRTEQELVETVEERNQYFRFWRINLAYADIQRVTRLLAVLLLLPSIVGAALLYYWLRNDALFQIQARYGGVIIPVEQANFQQSRQIQVAAIKDLARLAQQNGGFIFQKKLKDDQHLFFVPDGQITYFLMVPDPNKET